MNIFAIGDLHLGFEVHKPMDIFGPSWEQHTTKLENHWRQLIKTEDIVLVPGDISWAQHQSEAICDLKWLNDLPGKKICIRGNHDYWWDRPAKLNKAYDHIVFLQNTAYMIGRIAICGTRGWECVSINQLDSQQDEEQRRMIRRERIRLQLSLEAAMKAETEEIWVMLHYPPTYYHETTSTFTQLLKEYPVKKVIYGHLHDTVSWEGAIKGEQAGIHYELVAADYLNFVPKKIGTISSLSQ